MSNFKLNEAIEALDNIKDLQLYLDEIYINGNNTEESVALTNPDYFVNRVNSLNFWIAEDHTLPDEFF